MPQESNRSTTFTSSCKSLQGLKGLNSHDASIAEEIFKDAELAQRKAEEAASRRYQAAEWLRRMDQGASDALPKEPSEEEFRLALRNGLILCNVLNKVNPGAVSKVVENPIFAVQSTDGPAQSAIQYFENMRNFLVAVGEMKLLTFEASDLEKGGSSFKVVDCILCLKGYHEWKQAGGIGVWRYGGTVKIICLPKSSPSSSLIGSESADESLDDSVSPYEQNLLDFRRREIDFSQFCICGGRRGEIRVTDRHNASNLERLDRQQKQIEELKSVLCNTKIKVKQVQSSWEQEIRRLEYHLKGLEVTSSSYQKILEENRLLYSQVQDLKGSIRVYCRVRPFLPGQHDRQSTIDFIGENGDIMIVNPHKQGKEARRVFTFNKVFAANVTQQQVFADTQPLIRSVLDGYNVCIFAYGQTGSGKTYTMSGPDLSAEKTWGVNYRALNDLFQMSKARIDILEYEVHVQMIEIYNEQVRDLLVLDGSNRRLDIRNNSRLNGLNVPDASLVSVQCTEDVLELMKIGQRNRAVGATALNERSSRSHSVLTVHVQGKELVSGSILRGCLHLVDLAGSERVDKSEAIGERLKEAQHINKSLSALGDVISALAQKSTHIPYRNSKLTQVLQDSLGGQAKTLMFVHINPEVNAIGETISTLKFAERVASVELGAARSNKETSEIRELKEEVAHLKWALEKKEAELEQLKGVGTRVTMESLRMRAVSPLNVSRCGINSCLKPEVTQRTVEDKRSFEARSCSSGKQRRSRFPSRFTDKDPDPNMAFLAEENYIDSGKPRSPSPPVRRSLSTDRGALIKSRLKLETLDSQPTMKLQFPVRVAVNKSVIATPATAPSDNNSKGCWGPHELIKQDNISDVFYNLNKASSRKAHLEHEEELYKQALNVKQGGIRKSKPENKAKVKHQLPTRMQKSDAALALFSNVDMEEKEEARLSDFSEPKNEHGMVESLGHVSLRTKRFQQNFAKNSQNLESRGSVQAVEPLLVGKHENKLPTGLVGYTKDSSNNSMSDFRRSRSSHHGKFTILP